MFNSYLPYWHFIISVQNWKFISGSSCKSCQWSVSECVNCCKDWKLSEQQAAFSKSSLETEVHIIIVKQIVRAWSGNHECMSIIGLGGWGLPMMHLFSLFVFLNPSAFNYYLLLIAGSLPQCALNPVFTADGLPSPSLVLPKVSS